MVLDGRVAVPLVMLLLLAGCMGAGGDATRKTILPSATPLATDFTFAGPNLTQNGSLFQGSIGGYAFTAVATFNATSYAWRFGDNETGSGAAVRHNYTRQGTFIIRLTAADGAGSSASVEKTLVVTGANGTTPGAPEGGPYPTLSASDASGDTLQPYGDLTLVTLARDAHNLTAVFHFADLQPGADSVSLWLPDLFLNDHRIEGSLCPDPAVYDYKEKATVANATATVAVDNKTWTLVLPFASLTNVTAPYQVYFASYVGEPCLGNSRPDDRVPDDGTLAYG